MTITARNNSSDLIYYVSHMDSGVDWDRVRVEHDISFESYRDSPTEEDAKKLVPKEGEKLTVWRLAMPTPKTLKEAMAQEDGVPQAHYLATRCIREVENFDDETGRPFKLKYHKATSELDARSQAAIPAAILWEIGFFLLVQGSGVEAPLSTA